MRSLSCDVVPLPVRTGLRQPGVRFPTDVIINFNATRPASAWPSAAPGACSRHPQRGFGSDRGGGSRLWGVEVVAGGGGRGNGGKRAGALRRASTGCVPGEPSACRPRFLGGVRTLFANRRSLLLARS